MGGHTGTETNTMRPGLSQQRRVKDGSVTIPQWLVGALLTLAIGASGTVATSIASEAARGLDNEHINKANPRFEKIEAEQVLSKIERHSNADKVANIITDVTDLKQIAKDNQLILLRLEVLAEKDI